MGGRAHLLHGAITDVSTMICNLFAVPLYHLLENKHTRADRVRLFSQCLQTPSMTI